ncbi:MAG: GGDEF domain-containing protein [Lysobacteraceae bacterium]
MSALEAIALGLAAVFVLALGFHRHRAAQLAGLLCLFALGLDAGSLHRHEATLRLTPWLLLACAAMPEPRLLSRRHGALLIVVGLLVLMVLYAPPRLLAMPVTLASWPLWTLDPGHGARLLLTLAALVCGLRAVLRPSPLEGGLALALIFAALAVAYPANAAPWLGAATLTLAAAILYAGYRMAFLDALTGLPNRRALDEALARLSGEYSLAMVDVDHFKAFNDRHGHDAGDRALRAVARCLRRWSGGQAYRYGGEEFCVIYRGLDAREAGGRLERAREQMASQPIDLPPRTPSPRRKRAREDSARVAFSGGVARRCQRLRGSAEVLKAADQALYKAKHKGRNRIERG